MQAIVLGDVIQVFVWICALGAALAIPMTLRKSRVGCIAWLSLYLLAYWQLSVHGRYAGDLHSSRWMPRHCEKIVHNNRRDVPVLNALGAFFAPLVWVDRIAIHPGKKMQTGSLRPL